MPLKTIYKNFIELRPNNEIKLPVLIDDLSDLIIHVGSSAFFATKAIKIELCNPNDEILIPDKVGNGYIFFKDNKVKPGNYFLKILTGNLNGFNQSEVQIEAQSHLDIIVDIVYSTRNSVRQGSISVVLKTDKTIELEDTTVRLEDILMPYRGNGIFTCPLTPDFPYQDREVNITIEGFYQNIRFKRNLSYPIFYRSGFLVFTGPYSWHLSQANNLVLFQFGVKVFKKERFGLLTTLTDNFGMIRISEGTDYSLEQGENSLTIEFSLSEFLEYGPGPYKVDKLFAYLFNDDTEECDEIREDNEIPLLYLTK